MSWIVSPHEFLFALLCFGTCGYALVRGGAPERIVACGFLAAYLLTGLTQSALRTIYHSVEWSMVVIDGSLLAIIVAVALLSTRYWALPMASMQIIDVLGHVARMLDPHILPAAYFILVALISFPMVFTLAGGVWWHRRRLGRYGIDFAWVSELPPFYRAGWLVHERSALPLDPR